MINFNFIILLLLFVSIGALLKGDENDSLGTVIGIDLGTTFSCVGVFVNDSVQIIPNDQGNYTTPSYVTFTEDGERLIGDAAKNQFISNPKNSVFGAKRLLGMKWSDETVQRDIKIFPFRVLEKGNKPHIKVSVKEGEKKTFAAEEISAMVLVKMKEIAEKYLGGNVTHAVVTVPAYFNDAQRQATRNAAVIAGLNILRIINEPIAAAIAYGLDKAEREKNILVFHLGGSTFDVSLLTIESGVFEVITTNGDTHLGGEDFDQRVMDHFIKLYKKKNGRDLQKDSSAVQKLRREVEKAKINLSVNHETRIEVESLFEEEDFSETLTRAKFEELNADLFKSLLQPIKQVIKDGGMNKSEIDEIIFVGGSLHIPKIQEIIKDYFDRKEPSRADIKPEEAAAYGAAIQGGIIGGQIDFQESFCCFDVSPLTMGIETVGGVMAILVSRNTIIPAKKSQFFSTAVDNQQNITIQVFEGERLMTKDNHLLCQFDLNGIPPAPRGVPQIEVTFEIDVNGILRVSAEDKGTGKKEKITITNDQYRLSPDDIERMVNDGEKFADEDKKVKEKLDLRYQKAISWMDSNQDTFAAEPKKDKKKVEDIATPIVSNIDQQQGGQPGGDPGGEQQEGGLSEFDEKEDKEEL